MSSAMRGLLLLSTLVGYAQAFLLPHAGRLHPGTGAAASIQRHAASTATRYVRSTPIILGIDAFESWFTNAPDPIVSSTHQRSRRRSGRAWASAKPEQPLPAWPPKGFRPFKSLREEGSDLVDLSMEPHKDSLLETSPSQFFAGFRLRELDEGDSAMLDGERTIGISLRGLLWFLTLLYPFMGLGLLCSSGAQYMAGQAGNPSGAVLDIIDFPDLKSIHG